MPKDPKWLVEAPDGKVIQFPDNFTDSDVTREMTKLYPVQQRANYPGTAAESLGEKARPYFQTLGREAGAGWDAFKGLFTGPYQALTAPMSPEEQKQFPSAANPAMPQPMQALSRLGLAANRAVGDPTATALMWYGRALAGQNPGFNAQGTPIAMPGGRPSQGPIDQALSVLPEAVGQGAGTEVGGKAIAGIGPRAATAADVYQTRSALSDAINQADGLTRQAKTLNVIDKTAQQLFNKVQQKFQVLQGRHIEDAQKSIEPLIAADKAAGSKPVLPLKAALDSAEAIVKSGYTPSKLEQGLLDKLHESPADNVAKQLGYGSEEEARAQVGGVVFDDFLRKGAGGISPGGLDLEGTLKLRTAIGRAMARAKDPSQRLVLTSAYEGLRGDLSRRFNEVQGKPVDAPSKAFEQYNQNHRAAFQLENSDSFTSKFMDTPLDHHEARQRLGGKDSGLIGSNLTQVAQQMRDKGMNPNELYQLQDDAKRVVNAHDSVMGRYNKSLFRMMSSGDAQQAALPLGVYAMARGAGMYGMVPYMLASLTGKLPQEMAAMTDFGRVMRRLGVPDKMIGGRVQPGPFVPSEVPPGGVGGLNVDPAAPIPTPGAGPGTPPAAPPIPTINPAQRAASDAAFQRNFPPEQFQGGLSPMEQDLWQQSGFGKEPQGDIGAKVRAANPEPTRAEVKAGEVEKAKKAKAQ